MSTAGESGGRAESGRIDAAPPGTPQERLVMKQEKLLAGSANQPLHSRLREWLIAHIDSYPTGAKLPTEFELADRFGISRLTVHKAINQLQSDGYVTRIRSKGTFVTRKDQRVRAHAAGSKGTVIIAYADWFSYDIWAKVDLAEIQAVKHGYGLVNLKLTRLGGYSLLESLVGEFDDLRGILVIPPGGIVSEADLAFLDSLNVPTVVLCDVDGVEATKHIATVSQNMDEIARLDIETALSMGARKIAHIGAEPLNPLVARFTHALKRHAHGRIELLMPEPSTRVWNDSPGKAHQMTLELLGTTPGIDALALDSFPTALAASRAVHDSGCRAPLMLINAPYFGLDRFLDLHVVLVYASIKTQVARAFGLLGAPEFPPATRCHQVECEVKPSSPSDPFKANL
jgi:DNA-binding transcriptional regulator YhcF (GntR family)